MSSLHKIQQTPENRLLAALPAEDYQRLLPELQPVTFSLGEVLYESQRRMDYVYFPTTSHVSLLYTMIDGSTAEVGLVGNVRTRRHRAVHGRRYHAQPRHRAGRGRRLQDESVCDAGGV